jgi:hypothetical protein
VPLDSEETFDKALESGSVAAIIDESPYMDTFLTTYGCKYTDVDSSIAYFSGFGFVSNPESFLPLFLFSSGFKRSIGIASKRSSTKKTSLALS